MFFGYWFLAPEWAEQVALPYLIQLQDKTITIEQFAAAVAPNKMELPTFITPKNITNTYNGSASVAKSVGVIPIQGSMMKEDFCGSPGMVTMGNWIRQMNADANVSAIVLNMETPGGSANGVFDLAAAVRNSQKPILTFVDYYAASAGMWPLSASTETYANNSMSRVGSIGTYTSIRDFTAAEARSGIKTIDVYSRMSPDKNGPYREALNGNLEPMRDELDALTRAFHNSVKQDRGSKLKLDKENVLTGKMYFAEDAVSFGLIDGIMNFEATVERARELGSANKPKRSKILV